MMSRYANRCFQFLSYFKKNMIIDYGPSLTDYRCAKYGVKETSSAKIPWSKEHLRLRPRGQKNIFDLNPGVKRTSSTKTTGSKEHLRPRPRGQKNIFDQDPGVKRTSSTNE